MHHMQKTKYFIIEKTRDHERGSISDKRMILLRLFAIFPT